MISRLALWWRGGEHSQRDFGTYWLGQAISNLGSSFTQFALPLLVFELTKSALNLAIAFAAYDLPYILFGIVIGAWIDRVNRKRLMIITDLIRAALLAGIPLLAGPDHSVHGAVS